MTTIDTNNNMIDNDNDFIGNDKHDKYENNEVKMINVDKATINKKDTSNDDAHYNNNDPSNCNDKNDQANDQYDRNDRNDDDGACYDSNADDEEASDNDPDDNNNDDYANGDENAIKGYDPVNDYNDNDKDTYHYDYNVFGQDYDSDDGGDIETMDDDPVINMNDLGSPHVPDHQLGREAVMKNEPEQISEGDLDGDHLIFTAIDYLPQVAFGQSDFNAAYHQMPVKTLPMTFQDAYHSPDPIQKEKWHSAFDKELKVLKWKGLFVDDENCEEQNYVDVKSKNQELDEVLLSNTHNMKGVGGCCLYCCVAPGS